jgi:hypothetical protein
VTSKPFGIQKTRVAGVGFVLALALALASGGSAQARAATASPLFLVSGPDPLPAPPDSCGGDDAEHQDWEWEPSLAVNPANATT